MASRNKTSRPRSYRALYPAIVGVLALTSPDQSLASFNFPQYLIDNYAWAGTPAECTLCHTSSPGNADNAVKPFANALKERGLDGLSNTTALDTAIMMLQGTDTDGDGFSDVEELSGAGDPNDKSVGPGGFTVSEPVEYGCVGGTIAGRTGSDPSTALAAAGFVAAALLWSRRRRRY